MKTILQALKDEIHYNLGSGFFENRLLSRGLNGDDECTAAILNGKPFKGAVADSLISLLGAENYSEGDVQHSLTDKSLILKQANAIYSLIGEPTIGDSTVQPTVYIGG